MFILTDGKNYVMDNPMKAGEYMSTTSSSMAKEFQYKQARALLNRGGKKVAWMRNYKMVDLNSGETVSKYYRGNANVFIGSNDIDFDESILEQILDESISILGLAGWDEQQLNTYENLLSNALSKYDSAESDILHAMQKYKEDRNGKKPQAHKMTKIGYLLDDIRDKHKRIKQCQNYIRVMKDAITYKYDLNKLKLEISKAKTSEYKGRTEYYRMALELLELQ